MLRPLLEDEEAADCLAFLVSALRNRRLPVALKPYILAGFLLALEKPKSGKHRPVRVGKVIYRCATSMAVSPLRKRTTEILDPIQLMVGVERGVETAFQYVSALCTDNELTMWLLVRIQQRVQL